MDFSWQEEDELLRDTVRATYPEHEHERFLAHFRGLVDLWINDRPAAVP